MTGPLDTRAATRRALNGGQAALVQKFDWAGTPLGACKDWPPELKTAVGLVLESHFPAAIVWGPEYTTIYNDAFRPILGEKPEALGRSFAEIWAEAWEHIGPIATRAYRGEATYIEDYPLVIERFGHAEQAWFTFCYSPLRLADGTVAGFMDTVVETTQTVQARAQLDVANLELGHRLKNAMATVQAIAIQTLRGVAEQGAVDAFLQRIFAMAQAHDVLIRQGWTAASLGCVAAAALAPFDALAQITSTGPDVEISPQAALALALLLNELATNAAKYGALSSETGRVTLSWTLDGDRLQLAWRESGGPPAREPTHRGFGSRLLDMGLCPHSVVSRRYPASGFELDLTAPLHDVLNSIADGQPVSLVAGRANGSGRPGTPPSADRPGSSG